MSEHTDNIIEAAGLAKHYRARSGPFAHATVRAVDGIDFAVMRGEVMGLVGESGSGKSTVARLLLRLIDPTAGRIRFDGRDITQAKGAALRSLRRRMQIVFQNPHSSLNGRHTIFDAIAEPLLIQDHLRGAALRARVMELIQIVGLPPAFMYRYPHELSGGQKQRVCIARAVALKPSLLILDEPTSALDVSVQAQVLGFLDELRKHFDLTYILISHNLAVVRQLCDRVAVMYLGRIVEQGPVENIFSDPRHPYTRALLAATPRPQAATHPPPLITGDIPSPSNIPAGCRFHTRCPARIDGTCNRTDPAFTTVATRHQVACHLA